MNKQNKTQLQNIVSSLVADYNEPKEVFANTCAARLNDRYKARAEALASQALDDGFNFSSARHFIMDMNVHVILSRVYRTLYERYYGV